MPLGPKRAPGRYEVAVSNGAPGVVWVSACLMGESEDVAERYLGRQYHISRCHLRDRANKEDGRRWRCLRRRSLPIFARLATDKGDKKAKSTCVPPSPGMGLLVLYHKLL